MIVERRMKKWSLESGLHDYLHELGIQNSDLYLAAGVNELENPNRYLNIDIAAARLKMAIENRELVGITQD
mgnify:CR=1 FL=1